nr:MAG: hypothetical protein [Bacteriophage sp.]
MPSNHLKAGLGVLNPKLFPPQMKKLVPVVSPIFCLMISVNPVTLPSGFVPIPILSHAIIILRLARIPSIPLIFSISLLIFVMPPLTVVKLSFVCFLKSVRAMFVFVISFEFALILLVLVVIFFSASEILVGIVSVVSFSTITLYKLFVLTVFIVTVS